MENDKITNTKPLYFLLFSIFISSSFDIFLNFNILGFSLRMVFILIIIFSGISVLFFSKKAIVHIQFIGWKFYFIWILFLVAFVYNTNLITRNIAYLLWLLLYTLFIISINFFKTDEKNILKVIKYYILSFKVMGIFGIVQFISALIGFNLFVTDWWVYNVLPRVNGFSYEPSYFSTYLMIGWAICYYLLRIQNYSLKEKLNINNTFWIITICQFLTSSRMGILLMGIIFIWPYLYKLFRNLTLNRLNIKSIIIIITVTVTTTLVVTLFWDKISFLFNGLGIGGTSSHSSGRRIEEFWDTLQIFFNSPIIGYSLGGISSAIAQLRGITITSQIEAKNFEGMNIFAEVLAASGLIGFIFFCLFIYSIYQSKRQMDKLSNFLNSDLILIYRSLIYALTLEFVLLCLNQNILRAYLWVHIAIINFLYFSGLHLSRAAKSKLVNSI